MKDETCSWRMVLLVTIAYPLAFLMFLRPPPLPLPLPPFCREEPIAHFTWHQGPITSIEWAPDDENTLLVSSSDNSVTLWDMSLEEDAEAEIQQARAEGLAASSVVPSSVDPRLADVPPQLLFEHRGQEDNKEAHFHAQLPGVVFSAAFDGLNMWKPNVTTVT
jgi:ribosome assembly protein RRB1